MVTIIKLGGSLITDKSVEQSFRADVVRRLASEIARAIAEKPDLKLIVGHGSGSFGHFEAKRHGTIHGVHSTEQWRGFAKVAMAASELNYLVAHAFNEATLPIWRIQPSASTLCRDGKIVSMALNPITIALDNGIIPLIFGDVALDEVRGGTITSTETIIEYLCQHIEVRRILLLGEVVGVLDEAGQIIPQITPYNIEQYISVLGGSSGTDVTGGMYTKVHNMLHLTTLVPGLQIHILSGLEHDNLYEALIDDDPPGTLIHGG